MPAPSPVCLINGASTTPAPSVVASATVNGSLASDAGVKFWTIACTSTDDQNTADAINATLSVDHTAKTFSFTAPASLGSAVVFTSTVGILGPGLDANGRPQSSYTATFKVNVKTSGGQSVLAVNEALEEDPVFGWIIPFNDVVRNGGGGGSGTGNQGQFNVTLSGTVLSGTVGVTKDSATVTSTANQTAALFPGDLVLFGAQASTWYQVSTVSSGSFTLSTPYSGTTNSATSATSNRNSNVGTTGLSTLLIGGLTSASTIDGIATTASTKPGLDLVAINTTAYPLTIIDQASSVSTSTNRIITGSGNGGAVVLKPFGGRCTFRYETTNNRWQLVNRGWETQSPIHFDIREKGAKGDGVTDCADAIEGAIATAATSVNPTIVHVPRSGEFTDVTGTPTTFYRIKRPIFMTQAVRFLGDFGGGNPKAGNAITIGPLNITNDFTGPALVVSPATVAPTRTKRGNFWYQTFQNGLVGALESSFIDLTEYDCGEINGYSAWTFAMRAVVNNSSGGICYAASGGGLSASDAHSAFSLLVLGSNVNGIQNQLQVSLTTSAGIVSVLTGSGMSAGEHDIEVDLDSSSGNIYVYVDGVHVGHSTTGTPGATIIQDKGEHFCIGAYFTRFLRGAEAYTLGSDAIDFAYIRMSKVARHTGTSSFTAPTSEGACDANTLVLLSFWPDDGTSPHGAHVSSKHNSWLVAMSGYNPFSAYTGARIGTGSAVWYEVHGLVLQSTSRIPRAEVGHLNLGANLRVTSPTFSRFHDLIVTASNASIIVQAFAYENHFEDIFFTCQTPARNLNAGILVMAGAGDSSFERITAQGSGQWAIATASGGIFRTMYTHGFRTDVTVRGAFCGIAGNDGFALSLTLEDLEPSDEGNLDTELAMLYLNGLGSVDGRGIGLFMSATYSPGAAPAVYVDACKRVSLSGLFGKGGAAGGIVKIGPNQTSPVEVDGYQYQGGPWLDPGGTGFLRVRDTADKIKILTVGSDADITVAMDDFLYGGLDIRDPSGLLSTTRKVNLPTFADGYVLRVTNYTHQSLTFKSAGAQGVTVAAACSATIRSNGVRWIRVTGDAALDQEPWYIFGTHLKLDLDSRFGVTNGPTTVTWADQSTFHNNASNSVANAPTYSASGGINNLPKFTTAGSSWLFSNTNVVPSGSDRTVYAVVTPSGSATFPAWFCFRQGNPAITMLATLNAHGSYAITDVTTNIVTAAGMPSSGTHIIKWALASGAPTVALDGAPLTTTGPSPGALASDTGTNGYIVATNTAGQAAIGDMYRFLVIDRVVTGPEETLVMAYLNAIYT